jgi:hypothetical protein
MQKFMKYAQLLFLLSMIFANAYAWNSLGHRLVVQIACDHLNSQTLSVLNQYNRALDRSGRRSLVGSASWLDTLRRPDELWMQPMHYINIPYAADNTPTKPPNTLNAVSSINKAMEVLNNPHASRQDKGFQLRVLMHVVGDIHQPLHSTSLFSKRFPQGDKGGNLFRLKHNAVADNLHAYWDKGGGLLVKKQRDSNTMLRRRALAIEKRWPCDAKAQVLDPQLWANESHQIAVKEAYAIPYFTKPSKLYKRRVNKISEQRIALAGCRLATLLNRG